jgi:gliding motility-associated-like protein
MHVFVNDTVIAHYVPLEKIIPVVYVPSTFTPNNDGLNDVLKIFHSPSIQGGSMTIYDRWGSKVKHFSSLDDTWDATHMGTPVDQGVFPYILSYFNDKGHELLVYGQITILR